MYESLMLKFRDEAGISKNNPYVFGMPRDDDTYLEANRLIREYSAACNKAKTLRYCDAIY